jgi:hypothetical protein
MTGLSQQQSARIAGDASTVEFFLFKPAFFALSHTTFGCILTGTVQFECRISNGILSNYRGFAALN